MDNGKVQKQWKNKQILQNPPQERVTDRPESPRFPENLYKRWKNKCFCNVGCHRCPVGVFRDTWRRVGSARGTMGKPCKSLPFHSRKRNQRNGSQEPVTLRLGIPRFPGIPCKPLQKQAFLQPKEVRRGEAGELIVSSNPQGKCMAKIWKRFHEAKRVGHS